VNVIKEDNTSLGTFESAARGYAERGLCMLPIQRGAKQATLKGWPEKATKDPGVLNTWFSIGAEKRNLGVLTGYRSGIIVIDVDSQNLGCEFDQLTEELGELPDTYTVKTGSGGYHFYFRYPEGHEVSNSVSKIGKNVDIRGNKGYVVAPPSIIKLDDGQNGYYTVEKVLPFADLPPKWLVRLTSEHPSPAQRTDTLNDKLAGPKRFELPEQIPDGDRNDTLFRYSGHLVAKGVPQEQILGILRDTNKVRCKPPLHENEVQKIFSSQCRNHACTSDEWPEPIPFDLSLRKAPKFNLQDYPDAFQPWIKDSAERMQCPPEYIACSLMVSAAAALGNSIAICPKALDTAWVVVPTLWGAIVGRPGVKKSPALDTGLKYLQSIEKKLHSEYTAKLQDYAKDKINYDISVKQMKSKGGADPTGLSNLATEPEKPRQERVIVNDATPEKLVDILVGSPRGVLVQLDEITALFEGFNKKGNEGARSFYLTGWNGLGSYSVDRIGRGSTTVPRVNICLLGGIQPSKLEKYINEATNGGGNDDGLMQRLQFLVYPEPPVEWKQVDRVPDFAAQTHVAATFSALRDTKPLAYGAITPLDSSGVPYLQFDRQAQATFDGWMMFLETRLRTGGYPPAVESHFAKYRSLVPILALLDHLIDGSTGAVKEASLFKAIGLANFLWKHALRAYGYKKPQESTAHAIAQKLIKKDLGCGFTVRDIYRHQWAQLKDKGTNEKALELLITHHWLRKHTQPTGGKAKVTYQINPLIYEID
jgi:hypothetical protein